MTSAEYLHSLANHFARGDWQWTRKTGIKHIRYVGAYSDYNTPHRRLARAFRSAFRVDQWERQIIKRRSPWRWLLSVWAAFVVNLRTDNNLPDGKLNNASILCYWEEDGEYLQMVQPSVGSLLADFLMSEPEHPHAKLIADELDRISADYDRRIRAGLVAGGAE